MYSWRRDTMSKILSLHPSLVVIGNVSSYVFETGKIGQVEHAEWAGGARRTLQPLIDAGIPVLLMRDVPRPTYDVQLVSGVLLTTGGIRPQSVSLTRPQVCSILSTLRNGRPRGRRADTFDLWTSQMLSAREQRAERIWQGWLRIGIDTTCPTSSPFPLWIVLNTRSPRA
jgi:hypothetical protein